MQTLIERPESQRPPALGLGSCAAGRAACVAMVREGVVAAGGLDMILRERSAHAHGYQHVEDTPGDARNHGPDGAGEELGKGESLTGIAAERARLGLVEVGKDGLVESEVGPTRDEAVDSEQEGYGRENGREAQGRHNTNVEERESGHAKREDAAKEGDGVGGNELAESDEEGDLEWDRAGDGHESVKSDMLVSHIQQQWVLAGLDPVCTYVHRSFLVKVKKRIKVAKQRAFGIREVTSRNLASSREDQARSR